jgi:hypothetical protein
VIKLYGIPASRAARCLWMLEELDLEYENVPTHFIGDSKKPDYLKLNRRRSGGLGVDGHQPVPGPEVPATSETSSVGVLPDY